MDSQTYVALAVVFLAAFYVLLRTVAVIKNWLVSDPTTSCCGRCRGCANQSSIPLVQIQGKPIR